MIPYPTPIPQLPHWSLYHWTFLTQAPASELPTWCLSKKQFGLNQSPASISPHSLHEKSNSSAAVSQGPSNAALQVHPRPDPTRPSSRHTTGACSSFPPRLCLCLKALPTCSPNNPTPSAASAQWRLLTKSFLTVLSNCCSSSHKTFLPS